MTAFRLLRIAGIAIAFKFVFDLSQAATAARNAGETTPGIGWAVGVLSLLFLVSAFVSERMKGPEASVQKDLLWGLGVGGLVAVATRLLAFGSS
jgi:hypothetical protein